MVTVAKLEAEEELVLVPSPTAVIETLYVVSWVKPVIVAPET